MENEEQLREEWREHAVHDDEWESFDIRYFANDIASWWLEKIAQARQEERDRIWAESNTPEKTFGITDKNDIGGAILLSDLRTIIFNTPEHE